MAELGGLYQAAARKADLASQWPVYDGVAGVPGGTHFIIQLHKSLAALDSSAVVAEALGAALGVDGTKRAAELAALAIEESRTDIYAFDPSISWAPDSWISADPGFWTPGRRPD